MKKFFYLSALTLGLMCTATACSDDEGDDPAVDNKNLDYTTENADSWGNYMRVVAQLLVNDSEALYYDWANQYNNGESYASFFKAQDALESVEQLIDGCYDIANEVGTAKIGEPFDYYMAGDTERALYAVESWYSWHSREDYRNNIYSIRNAYYGTRDGNISNLSLSEAVAAINPDLDTQVKAAIAKAAAAIWAIPSPFRNNINSSEAEDAMEACVELGEILKGQLKGAVENIDKTLLSRVVSNYVDVVVLPTYQDLVANNRALLTAVEAFQANPSNTTFSRCASAWLAAREPWETSEAFLFGPVADKGLDPNMDSWPLDQDAIVQILKSGNYDYLEWSGDYDEDNDNIASKQAVRGYHTLEFLIFKDGKARTIQ